MLLTRTLTLTVTPILLGGLVGCGSSGNPSSSPSQPSVKDAAMAFQNALINDDPAGACSYIDAAALQVQIAKAGPAFKGKDCTALLTTVLSLAKSTGQAIKPARDITVVSQSGDSATVRVTAANGKAEISTWKLENGSWKVTANSAAK